MIHITDNDPISPIMREIKQAPETSLIRHQLMQEETKPADTAQRTAVLDPISDGESVIQSLYPHIGKALIGGETVELNVCVIVDIVPDDGHIVEWFCLELRAAEITCQTRVLKYAESVLVLVNQFVYYHQKLIFCNK